MLNAHDKVASMHGKSKEPESFPLSEIISNHSQSDRCSTNDSETTSLSDIKVEASNPDTEINRLELEGTKTIVLNKSSEPIVSFDF